MRPSACLQGVPVNDLHACGYISIGCEPCTRPVLPNQAEREGRWWWEDAAAVSGVLCCAVLCCAVLCCAVLCRAVPVVYLLA